LHRALANFDQLAYSAVEAFLADYLQKLSLGSHFDPPSFSMSARMSSTLQAETRGDNLIALGKRPFAIPAHQADLLTGIRPLGATICGKRTKPTSGRLAAVALLFVGFGIAGSPSVGRLWTKKSGALSTPFEDWRRLRGKPYKFVCIFSKMLRKEEAQKNFRRF
jgi:hypothetical protein